MKRWAPYLVGATALAVLGAAVANPAVAQTFSLDLGSSGSTTGRIVQLVALLTVLSLAPSILVMVTSFTRIVVVLSFLRSAMGVQQTPPNAVLVSLALFLTAFVMGPTLERSYTEGIVPLMEETIGEEEALSRTMGPIRDFMLQNVREQDLRLFMELANTPEIASPAETPLRSLIPAFMISELRRAFEIGFLLPAAIPPPAEEPISTALHLDDIRIELGYGLLAMVNSPNGALLTDQIKGLRRQLANEMGFVMPAVRIQDNMQLPANSYAIRIKEIEAGQGEVRPNSLLVMDPRGDKIELSGEETIEPTFGLPAMWVPEGSREEANFRGYTVVDPATVVTTHLTEIIKDNVAELLSYTETQKLLDELDHEQGKLVDDLIPTQISVGGVQRVLKNLLQERISIRDLPTILEGISEATGFTQSPALITEHVRARLSRQICHSAVNDAGYVPLVTLSPEWEQSFAESLIGQGDDIQLSMPPSRLQEFIGSVRETFDRFAMMGEMPALLTSPALRPYVRSIVERFRPTTMVLSQNEIHPKVKIKTLGTI